LIAFKSSIFAKYSPTLRPSQYRLSLAVVLEWSLFSIAYLEDNYNGCSIIFPSEYKNREMQVYVQRKTCDQVAKEINDKVKESK